MELIERYLQEVGHHLPRKNRNDILGEMRSALSDALDDQAGPAPTQQQVIELLKSYGEPRKVAAKYYPEGQYLIGPTIYPLFRLVAGIAIAAVAGAQVLAWLVALLFVGQALDPLQTLAGIMNSLPAALGWVVLVFIILQRFDVRPDEDDKPWDPTTLPPLNQKDEISRSEMIVGIVFQAIFISVLVAFHDRIGAVSYPGGQFFANPVLPAYLPWIYLSLLAGISLDVYLLWQGRWTIVTRLIQLVMNIYAIVILGLLSQAHLAWLQAHGISTFITAIEGLSRDIETGSQALMMQGFWMAFTVALIVTVIETGATIFKLVRKQFEK
jgi:hypothetical protein